MKKKEVKVNWDALRETVRTTDKAVLTKVVQSTDGHTIYLPKHFTEAGLDQSIVVAFTKTLRSGQGKEQIYKGGEPVDTLTGIHGLQVLEFIAGCFGVDSWKMGRGSRAAHLAEQLVECNFTPKEVET